MAQLSEEKHNAQKFCTTRAIVIRFANQKPTDPPIRLFDNQYMYRLKRLKGYNSQYWEAHFKAYLKKHVGNVVEASIQDVSRSSILSADNRIAERVTNGHFLY